MKQSFAKKKRSKNKTHVDAWLPVSMIRPRCKRSPDALGTPVLIWPRGKRDEGGVGNDMDGFAYYGRRATGSPAFYIFGREIHGITHWMPLPNGPYR